MNTDFEPTSKPKEPQQRREEDERWLNQKDRAGFGFKDESETGREGGQRTEEMKGKSSVGGGGRTDEA